MAARLIFVAATVKEDNAKSRERDNEENNENESSSSCCHQEQVVSSNNVVNIRNHQHNEPELKLIMDYLENGDLLKAERKARELVLGRPLYQVVNGILYHMKPDKSLQLIPPDSNWESLFHEVHSGIFGAHLKNAKIHGELSIIGGLK